MEIKIVPINDLKPADYNPREMTGEQYEQLKKSLEKFGLVEPIVVNNHPERMNVVIGGHQRLRIAKDLGHTEIPVHYVSLDQEKEKELNVRLNKNVGQWDMDALANNFDVEMLKDIGFTESELGMTDLGKDEDKLKDNMDSYLEGNIKQIVLYFKNERYETVIPQIQRIMEEFNVEDHSSTFEKLLEFYENHK